MTRAGPVQLGSTGPTGPTGLGVHEVAGMTLQIRFPLRMYGQPCHYLIGDQRN